MIPSHPDSKVIWIDGKLVPYQEAVVPVLTHSLHYGGAAFEGIRAYPTAQGKSAIFRGKDHYRRFLDSMRCMGYTTRYTIEDFLQATRECIRANDFKECYIRPLGFLDDSVRGLKLPDNPVAVIAIATWKWGKYMGDEGQKIGIRVAVSSLRRPDISTTLTLAKLSGNYLTSTLARREASKAGYDEALLLDPQGFVAEGSGENVFLVKDGVLFTPPAGYILPGITRDSVMQLARGLGYEVRESSITRNQVYLADEVFFTGTAVEVTPIREVDNHPIADGKPGPITKRLMDLFFKCTRGEVAQYQQWLDVV